MKVTAGLFIVNRKGEILIGHVTNQCEKTWSIPKGLVEDGEEHLNAALRETFEETDIDFRGYKVHIIPPQPYSHGKKMLQGFVVLESEHNTDFSTFEPICTSMVPAEEPFPEIDYFKWVHFDEVNEFIHETQQACIGLVCELHKKAKACNG